MQMQRLTSVQDCRFVTLCLGDVKLTHTNVNTEASLEIVEALHKIFSLRANGNHLNNFFLIKFRNFLI